jgi:hypothetical protein
MIASSDRKPLTDNRVSDFILGIGNDGYGTADIIDLEDRTSDCCQ